MSNELYADGIGEITVTGTIGGTIGLAKLTIDGQNVSINNIGDADTLGVNGTTGVTAANLPGRPQLEFFSYDTCLLGSPEVAAPLADLARVFIANAELDYADGWDYESKTKSHRGISAGSGAQRHSVPCACAPCQHGVELPRWPSRSPTCRTIAVA